MNYQILAIKWRPKCFSEIIGQKHILTAIKNSFLLNKIHQSWIISGTRGIGKTTIARLLSKSLNCKNGININPCQKCSNCKDIEKKCFSDLIEIDAASKTKVEEIKEILDTAKYLPTQGKFKIYIFDEVHMLSKYSFNTLLKILEEPPKYTKFILVTTELNKLPKTIISRCIHYNLQSIPELEISKHLINILENEKINFETSAIKTIAIESNGSIRDALNLLEQAIVISNQNITTSIVLNMFGILKKTKILKMMIAIFQKDTIKIMLILKIIYKKFINIEKIFTTMLKIIHNIAILKKYPILKNIHEISSYKQKISKLSKLIHYKDLQSYYKIILLGKKEIYLAPTPRIGLEMTLLSLLYFKPKNIFQFNQEIKKKKKKNKSIINTLIEIKKTKKIIKKKSKMLQFKNEININKNNQNKKKIYNINQKNENYINNTLNIKNECKKNKKINLLKFINTDENIILLKKTFNIIIDEKVLLNNISIIKRLKNV